MKADGGAQKVGLNVDGGPRNNQVKVDRCKKR